MSFDPYNRLLKSQESIRTPTPNVGTHLGVWGFIPSFFCIPESMKCDYEVHSWPTPLEAFALVASPRLGLRQEQIQSNM
jgi:hypothetical protein